MPGRIESDACRMHQRTKPQPCSVVAAANGRVPANRLVHATHTPGHERRPGGSGAIDRRHRPAPSTGDRIPRVGAWPCVRPCILPHLRDHASSHSSAIIVEAALVRHPAAPRRRVPVSPWSCGDRQWREAHRAIRIGPPSGARSEAVDRHEIDVCWPRRLLVGSRSCAVVAAARI